MADIAGSVSIEISGNIGPFEAALAKARQIATTFDAQITAQLNGAGVSEGLAKIAAGVEQTNAFLAKLTTTGTAASATMAKVAASTTATTAALTQVATATKLVNAEMASIGGSGGGAAALTAGTISAKEFALALEQTGGNLSKITPAMLGLATAQEAVAISSKTAAVGLAEVAVAEKEAAGLSAGVTREFMVLGAEVARGNFSRIPGSLLVLNERLLSTGAGVLTMGNAMKALGAIASVVFDPFVLGFLAITIGTEVALKAFGSMKGGISEVGTALEGNKRLIDEITASYPNMTAELKKYEAEAKNLPKSIVAADTANAQTATTKALADTMDNMRRQMDLLNTGDGDFARIGKSGLDAFSGISKEIKAGSLDAEGLLSDLGRIQLDPALSKNAHAFAAELEASAKKAVELEAALGGQKAIKDIQVEGGKAQQTLFDVSSGFKTVSASAGTADATIAKLFGTLNSGGGDRFGVTRSLGTQLQATVGMFETIDQAVQNSRQNQLAGMVQLEAQLRATTTEADTLKQALATAGGKDNIQAFFGDVRDIKNANSEIANATTTVNKLFAAMASGNTSVNAVFQGLDMIRQTLIGDGFPVDKVNAFIDSLVRTNQQLVADQGAAHQLNAAIQAIQNKTVTITVVTQQIGTGTKSIYDVGTTGGIGVTRYGGQSDIMTQQSYQVPSTAGGMVDTSLGGTSGVTVTRFGGARAAGGPIVPGMPYLVGEHGPELVVPSASATVIPNTQSLAMAQSGFTGQDPTKESDRVWTVLMNTEANTRKTAQLLDEIKTTSLASSSGLSSGSSSGGSSSASTSQADQLRAEYMKVLAVWKANFAAIGGGGIIGYGSSGLGATPEQIAHNIVYGGGGTSVGSASGSSMGTGYQYLHGGDTAPAGSNYQQALAYQNKPYGFATGGIDSSDSQKVEFFKNPNEKVIIARPDQFADVRPGSSSTGTIGGGSDRPITFTQTNHWSGNSTPSKDSLAAIRQQTSAGIRDALRSVYGR